MRFTNPEKSGSLRMTHPTRKFFHFQNTSRSWRQRVVEFESVSGLRLLQTVFFEPLYFFGQSLRCSCRRILLMGIHQRYMAHLVDPQRAS